jgi:CspA family cold shock protein
MSENKKHYGEVIFFDPKKGYGFLEWRSEAGERQKDLFVHFSDVVCDGFKTLFKGQKVSFGLGTNMRGEPKATEVTVLRH